MKMVEDMRNDGIQLYDNSKELKTSYSKAFSGCYFMLESLMPIINQRRIEGKICDFIKEMGVSNFIKMVYHIQRLEFIDYTKCAGNLEDFYLGHYMGTNLTKRELTKEEIEFFEHADQICLCIKPLLDKLKIEDDIIDLLSAAIYKDMEELTRNKGEEGESVGQ